MTQVITIKLRLRDRHGAELLRQARAVNYVWNYCNETQQKAVREGRKWLSNYDLQNLTAGSSKMLGIQAQTISEVCRYYEQSRKTHNRPWLRWRGQKSLGWVPFRENNVVFDGECLVFRGVRYKPMHLSPHMKPGMRFRSGSFNADTKGHWHINLPLETDVSEPDYAEAVGIDLGLKTFGTLSTGQVIEMPRFYRDGEKALASSQRARKSKRTRAIHAKARNRRKDFLHKASSALAATFGTIIVGDVSPSKLAKTTMSKSVVDLGWAGFKHMLWYKAIRHGGRMIEVSEAYTTQTCSVCGCSPPSRPRGIAGLRIREWICDECGAVHDRDVNAANNILRVGLDALVEGAAQMRSSHPWQGVCP